MTLEDIENKRKRLIFRSGHRGTKEMDLIMGSFAERHVPTFSEKELAEYEALLGESDPDLYEWIAGRAAPPPEIAGGAIFPKLKDHRLARPL